MYLLKNHIIFKLLLAIVWLGVFFLPNCARTFNPDIERGSTYKYKRGYPEVRLSAVGFWGEGGQPYIDIVADIVYGSLFYKRTKNRMEADLSVQIIIFDSNQNDKIITAERFPYNKAINNSQMAHSQDVFRLKKQVQVKPGRYQVELTVIDRHTNRRTTRISNTSIPDNNNISSLTNIRFWGKQHGTSSWFPVTTYDIPAKLDSLKFIYQVNVNSADMLVLNSKLVKFKADTLAAKPMYENNYSPSSLPYKGIEYSDNEIIQSNRRILYQQGSVSIEFKFTGMERGNYRFEVDVDGSSDKELYKARDFAIKSKNYPTLKSANELACPLIYLMNKKDYEALMSINDPDSLKQAVDRFWLKNIQNKSDAKSIIRLFYERVEEANKKFSNFKEGWKTDKGMIYILFGPPIFVRENLKEIHWSYSYNQNDDEYNYTFKRSKKKSEFYPFDHYIFQRDQHYFNIQYRQVQLWLSGQILARSI